MPATRHIEKHFTSSAAVRDVVIGMSDGLTVPFALAAGLSGAVSQNHVIVVAGLAEVAAGCIAMGLGGYLAARGDAEHYDSERVRELREVREIPLDEEAEIAEIFEAYGVSDMESRPVIEALKRDPEKWVDFMMRFELGLEEPERSRARISAMTIGGAYVVGGLVPLIPYMLADATRLALSLSAGVTLAALLVFGYVKGRFTGTHPVRSALQTLLVGGVAASAAFALAKLFSEG